MRDRSEVCEAFGRLYAQAEELLAHWLEDALNAYEESRLRTSIAGEPCESSPQSSDKKSESTVSVPLKDLAIATMILRRLQDGRLALESAPNADSQGEASELTKSLLEKFNSLATTEENGDETENGEAAVDDEI